MSLWFLWDLHARVEVPTDESRLNLNAWFTSWLGGSLLRLAIPEGRDTTKLQNELPWLSQEKKFKRLL